MKFKKGDKIKLIPTKLAPNIQNFKHTLTYDKPYRNNHFFSKEYPNWAFPNESYEPIYVQEFKNKLDIILEE